MEASPHFEIPLESLTRGVHNYVYELDSGFFEAHEGGLLKGGDFHVELQVEKIRSQFNLEVEAKGAADVACDRCLEEFAYPLTAEASMVVKYDSERPREEEEVIYVPYGTETFNVAKLIYDTIGLALPMSIRHDDAGLDCDPKMLELLNGGAGGTDEDEITDDNNGEIPVDSPWSALNALKQRPENK